MKRYIETQKYSECKLISILNARTYLTGEFIDPESEEYEELVDFARARYGAALEIKKLLKRLGMDFEAGPVTYPWISKNLPCEVRIWHPKLGYHAVCLVGATRDIEDYDQTPIVRVTNFFERTWISWKRLLKLIVRNLSNFDFGHDAVRYFMKGEK